LKQLSQKRHKLLRIESVFSNLHSSWDSSACQIAGMKDGKLDKTLAYLLASGGGGKIL
jgi:hypothetical protein